MSNVLTITYQCNFNGCDIEVNDQLLDLDYDDNTKCPYSQLSNYIIDQASEDCDDDGEFDGSVIELKQKSITKAQQLFNDEFEIKFEIGYDT